MDQNNLHARVRAQAAGGGFARRSDVACATQRVFGTMHFTAREAQFSAFIRASRSRSFSSSTCNISLISVLLVNTLFEVRQHTSTVHIIWWLGRCVVAATTQVRLLVWTCAFALALACLLRCLSCTHPDKIIPLELSICKQVVLCEVVLQTSAKGLA